MGLIKKEVNKDKKNVFLYRVTEKFLQILGVSDISQLDEFDKIKNLDLNSIENE